MISKKVWGIILLVSCAHALVHVFELSLPSVEQEIAAEYFPGNAAAGKSASGWLSFCWRLPWGLGALAAGLLVDRFGGRSMLTIYLLGCAAACFLLYLPLPLPGVFGAMFSMGAFACIYHPAGLALISHETNIENRSRALGVHGIFGSLGIGSAPFIAGFVLSVSPRWQGYYLVLGVLGLCLGLVFLVNWAVYRHQQRRDHALAQGDGSPSGKPNSTHAAAISDDEPPADWVSFFMLTTVAMMVGFVYSGVLTFLPRYMDQSGISIPSIPREGLRNYLAGGVLLLGCIGQYAAGNFARHRLLERQLTWVVLGNVPWLVWMAFASGVVSVVAAGLFAMVHFMGQPIYNSAIAKYVPRRRRSLSYGFGFAMGLGVGSMGAAFAGSMQSHRVTFLALAGVAAVAGCLSFFLAQRHRLAS